MIFEEVCKNPRPQMKTVHKVNRKTRKRGDLTVDTIRYFMMKDLKFARFYLLQKTHKQL